MENTRRHKRYQLDLVEINSKMVLAKYVKIIDISIGGVSLLTEKTMRVGSEYTLNIEGKGKVLTVRGVVVWSLLSESVKDTRGNVIPLYKAGMKFTDVSNKKRKEIENFIKAHKQAIDKQVDLYKPDGRRLHARIHIEPPEKAVMNFQESYKVKKLSLSGMLIESQHELEKESTLPVEMSLTEDKSITFTGRVVSCLLIKHDDLEHYDIGIDFIDISEQDRVILSEFIGLLDNIELSSSSL